MKNRTIFAALKCRALGGRAGIPTFREAVGFIARERPGIDFPLKG